MKMDFTCTGTHCMTNALIEPVPVYFHPEQLSFKPMYEWAFGERIDHPETTARAESIMRALRESEGFALQEPPPISTLELEGLHTPSLLAVYETATALESDFYPSVFPRGRSIIADPTHRHHAGYWCFDAGTPLNAQTWLAARWSAANAGAAADAITRGERLAYALSRPPGHHATRDRFGGYCYLNNAGVAARRLRARGRVAILDIDYHHGNGTQSLFYENHDVLTVSIHGDPREDFPYFTGFAGETGEGRGTGYNLNLPLPIGCDGQAYLEILRGRVARTLADFRPDVLVLAAGLDTYHRDPIGKFILTTDDIRDIGETIGRWGWPIVAVQEGGYYTPHLGQNALALLQGIRTGQRATG